MTVVAQMGTLLRRMRVAFLVMLLVGVGCVGSCAGDSVAGPYCGVFEQDDVTSIVGRVESVEDERSSVMGCRIHGERGILVAISTTDSWVGFGQGGNNAFTTLETITGGEGREIPGTGARVFSYLDASRQYPDAYAYWLEGRAGFTMYTVVAEDADETTVAALEELVIKYAPQVLDGVASRTEDPGPNWNDPATSAPSGEPSAAQTAESSREAESTSTGSPGQ